VAISGASALERRTRGEAAPTAAIGRFESPSPRVGSSAPSPISPGDRFLTPYTAPRPLRELSARFDASVFDAPNGQAVVRLSVTGEQAWDAMIDQTEIRLVRADPGRRADARISADLATWDRVAADLPGGMRAFRGGRLRVRENLHVGIGFLAATSGSTDPRRLRFNRVNARGTSISIAEAGSGTPMLLIHGLGATKASFLTTMAALADAYRLIAIDLPGFGDSDKPFGARYDAAFFADSVVAVLDALGLPGALVVGNSMGGRVALEVGLRAPTRTHGLGLLAPSLAWRRPRRWAPYLRLIRPELGALQPAPRVLTQELVRRVVPGARDGWAAAGVDEFMRSYLTPRGRAAFYAAARQIYLEEPLGERGFWTRLKRLSPEALFVWGRQDRLVPIGFARHIQEVLPSAAHIELDCGHVPQLERPEQTHAALRSFFAGLAKSA
jgi:pimeloyl-ACP methyl ester carboxylesterase